MTSEYARYGVGGSSASPHERGGGNSLLEQFEARIARLRPLSNPQEIARSFATDQVKLVPDKFAAAILVRRDGDYDILLGRKTESGYNQMDHYSIADEYHVGYSYPGPNTMSGFIMTSGDQRFIMVEFLEPEDHDQDKFKAALERYGVSIAFNAYPVSGDRFALVNYDGSSIAVGDYQQIIDKLIFNGWTTQVAERYGLTNEEWLRLRLTGELPEGKTPIEKFTPMEDEIEADDWTREMARRCNLTVKEYLKVLETGELHDGK